MKRFLMALAAALELGAPSLAADEKGWIALTGEKPFEAWRSPAAGWSEAGDARIDPSNPRKLVPVEGRGVVITGRVGRARNLVTRERFGDIELHLEFLVPKGSNSGVKFQGLYEIQILDSHGVARPTGKHCGGIYPRAELLPRYRYLDDGIAPLVNAARPPGEWQTLDAVFQAPRFDSSGKKTEDARLVRAVLNGQVIHENVPLKTPTGHAWHDREVAEGPLFLQGDHGPVAFRNVRVRPIKPPAEKG